jgi:hypothetical protein
MLQPPRTLEDCIILGTMTTKEHELIVMMFAGQMMRFKAIIDILRSRELISGDDFEMFEKLAYETTANEMFQAVAEQYKEFALNLGLPDPLPNLEIS